MKTSFSPRWLALMIAVTTTGAGAADLMDAWRAARDYDSGIASSRARREAGVEARVQGRAPLLPQINGSYSATRNYPKTPNGLPDYTTRVGGIQLTQTVFDWARFAGYSIGEQQALIADDQLKAADQDLIVRVARAYFDVLLAEDTLTYTRGAKDAFAQSLAEAKKRFEVGSATIVDTNEAQANFDNAVAVEIQAVNDLAIKRNAFLLLTNLPGDSLKPLAPKLPLETPSPANVDAWISRVDGGNLDVAVRRKQVLIADKSIDVSRAGHLPTLNLNAGWQKNDSNLSPLFGGNKTEGNSVGLTLTIPLFAGGGVQSQVREKAALRDAAREDLETSRRTAEQQVRTAYLGVTAGASQVVARQNVVKSVETQLASTRLGRDVGVRTSLDVLNAEQSVFQARRDLAQAKYAYLLSRLQLAQSVGQLETQDLAEINRFLAN
ncbi:TolC family outer membrane protein [Microvirgula curvata]|uniref:TolC family outer membrane protein n=1 Tax=Microvirgula TaxID=57479 RepID=UPI000DC31838|nr:MULTISPECIES: TolC family outer membrane protein [Microvirgula]RAS19811.1 outer membrane protein [Microvirgula sp. AG722]